VANISGFQDSGFREYKSRTSIYNISQNCEKMSSTLGFRGLGFHEYTSQSSTHNNSQICERRSVFREFGVQDFMNTQVNHQHTTTPEFAKSDQYFGNSEFGILRIYKSIINTQQISNLRKVISISRIRSSGFCECKCPNNNIYKPLKCEKREGGSRTSGFQGGLGFHGFHTQHTTIPVL
jgi:hypothetical protein